MRKNGKKRGGVGKNYQGPTSRKFAIAGKGRPKGTRGGRIKSVRPNKTKGV